MAPKNKHLSRLASKISEQDLLAPIWPSDDGFTLVDQTSLPFNHRTIFIKTADEMAEAIKKMFIRGSGAIGCAGALGAYLIVKAQPDNPNEWMGSAFSLLNARPTALILSSAVKKVLSDASISSNPIDAAASSAVEFVENQLEWEKQLGKFGAELIPDNATILTHCHSGALAGAGYGGRALSSIRAAYESGKRIEVISQETRPYLQGARITAWELSKLGIPVTLASDGMSGALMQMGKIDICIVGSDRIAINGDLANKTGTYLIALAAREFKIPFFTGTTRYNIDPELASGKEIPIELRNPDEILKFNNQQITLPSVNGLYPAFDITPANLITGIITEKGVIYPPYFEKLKKYINH